MAETPQLEQRDQTAGLDAFDLAVGLRVDTLNMNFAALQELGSFPETWGVTLRPGAALDVELDPPTVAVLKQGRFPEEVGRILFTLTLAEGTLTVDGVEIPVVDWGLTFPLNLAYADLIAELERAGRAVPDFLRARLSRFPPERFALKALLVDFTNAHLIVEGLEVRFGNARELTPEQMKVFKESLVRLLETLRSRPDANLLGLTAQPLSAGLSAADPQRWLKPTGGAMTAYQPYYREPFHPTLATLIVTQQAPVPVAAEAPYAYGYACQVLGQRSGAQGSLLISHRALLGYLMEGMAEPLGMLGVPAERRPDGFEWTRTRAGGELVSLVLRPELGTERIQVSWRWQHVHTMRHERLGIREDFDLDYLATGALTVRFSGPPTESGTSSHLSFRFQPSTPVCRFLQRSKGEWQDLSLSFLRDVQDPDWLARYVREHLRLIGPAAELNLAWLGLMATLYRGFAGGAAELQRLDALPPLLMGSTVMLPGAKDFLYRDLRFEDSLTGPHLVMGLYANI